MFWSWQRQPEGHRLNSPLPERLLQQACQFFLVCDNLKNDNVNQSVINGLSLTSEGDIAVKIAICVAYRNTTKTK
jgi:hypothetical protein